MLIGWGGDGSIFSLARSIEIVDGLLQPWKVEVETCVFSCLDNIRLFQIQVIQNVPLYWLVEQSWLLLNQPEACSEIVQVIVSDINIFDQNTTTSWNVETQQKV